MKTGLLQGCYKVVTRLLTSSQPCYKVVAWLNFYTVFAGHKIGQEVRLNHDSMGVGYNVATGVATNLDPGLWTGPCHGLDCGLDSRPLSLLNSLQVAQKRKEPGACSLKIAHEQ